MTACCPENYIHSSAVFYDKEIQGKYSVDNLIDVLNMDLSK